MEPDHTTPDDPPEGNKSDEKGNWHKRLRLREVAVHLPVMRSVNKCGRGVIVEGNKAQTARKSFKKPPLKGHQNPQGASISGKILRFSCSECKSDATFSPNDLSKHFQGVHQGSLPSFPCDMCGFVSHDFSSLQRHRLGHRDTFVRCEICNDAVQYTLLQLTRHFNMYHSLNGHYRCEKCKFYTKDVGTFVQHTHRHNEIQYKCGKCQHVSNSNVEYQKHLMVHSGTFAFNCHYCDYESPRKDNIIKHLAAVHGEEKKNKWRAKEESPKTLVNSSPGLKLLLTKNPTKETHWMSKGLHALSGRGLLDDYGRLSNPEKTLEETQQFLERTVAAEKDCKKWAKALKTDQQYVSQAIPALSQTKSESAITPSAGFLNPGSNGLTVLMVKNKISIPPNCTTKVMGFKMVDGKKHLVLKVIPSKQESLPKLESSSSTVKEIDSLTLEPSSEDKKNQSCVEDGTARARIHLNSSSCNISPKRTSPNSSGAQKLKTTRENDKIVSVSSQGDEHSGEQLTKHIYTEKLSSLEKKRDQDQFSFARTSRAASEKVREHTSPPAYEESCLMDGETSSNASNLEVEKHEYVDSKEIEITPDCQEYAISDSEGNAALNSSSQEVFSFHNYSKDSSTFSSDMSFPDENQVSDISELRTCGPDTGSCTLVDWKEMPDDPPMSDSQDRIEDEVGSMEETNQLPSSSYPTLMENVPDSEIEVDECIATVEEGSTLQSDDLDLSLDLPQRSKNVTIQRTEKQSWFPGNDCAQKVSEMKNNESAPDSEQQSRSTEMGLNMCSAAALGRILEEHSDAIISQQLEKERFGIAMTQDTVRPPTATLKFLQPFNVTEGKQQVFLQTAENGYAVPVQLQGSPGFKLITGSSVPPINVSYLKPGSERPANKSAMLAFTLNNGRLGGAAQVMGGKEACGGLTKGGGEESTALDSGVQQETGSGTRASSSQFVVNGSALKGPLFMSSPAHSLSRERTVNLPTCFLVQRPLPVASAVARTSGEPASSGLPSQAARPVLAVPFNSPDKPGIVQAGRQAFLLRYVSPVKSGICLNNPDAKGPNQKRQPHDNGGNRVLLKIIRNASEGGPVSFSGEVNSGVATQTATNQPVYLATGSLQSPCFLMSSNQSILTVSTGIKTSGSSQDAMHTPVTVSQLPKHSSSTGIQSKARVRECSQTPKNKLKRLHLPPPGPNNQMAKKKKPTRQKKPMMEDSSEPRLKAKRHSSKKWKEKEALAAAIHWEPVPREVERILRLSPFSPNQLIKCPRRNQPVIVLNHPDADIPEVANVMRMVNKHKGEVLKVALSQRTLDALSELDCGTYKRNRLANCHVTHGRRVRPENTVRERFILKLRLKKTSRNKYKVVHTTSDSSERLVCFSCWFCGRIFENQEDWIGHGQRHLMEATRDWNKLF